MPDAYSPPVKIIATNDGSHSLYLPGMEETYHSRHGALAESKYVFIDQGLKFYLRTYPIRPVRILEIGLGTGLNAWLSIGLACSAAQAITYTALEPYPLPPNITSQLNYPEVQEQPDGSALFNRIHQCTWGEMVSLGSDRSFCKIPKKLEDFQTDDVYHLVYFDAFAPSKQPEIWARENLEKTFGMMTDPGVLVTYCAQGQFKRDLKSIGFLLETLPGPPGKMEMVRAIKNSLAANV